MNNGNVNNNNKTNSLYVWPVRGGEWCELFSFENLYRSYLACRKRKRNTVNALRFEVKAEENLLQLSEELCRRTYTPSRSVCFVVERPKMREIIAADFRDRIVHHLLVGALQPLYESIFIHDSYACRVGKGIHKATERVYEFIRKGSANGSKRLYFMHLDIRNFFMTIDKTALYGRLEKKRLDDAVLWLARTIIFHNPVENCIVKGQLELFKHLPPHKSLFHAPVDKGLPVGNHTSQFFANVYLNELDQFVKHTLKCRYYIRYCDDFLILHESQGQLQEAKERIEEFARARLRLSLNDKYRSIAPVTNGIDFLGYVIHPDHTLARRRVVNNLRTKLEGFEKLLASQSSKSEQPTDSAHQQPALKRAQSSSQQQARKASFPQSVSGNPVSVFKYDYVLLDRLRATLASYWGHLKWADTHNLRCALIKRYSFITEYFKVEDLGFKPLYRYRQDFTKVKFQYLYYAGIFTGAIIFFQVGGFYEFYEEGAFMSLKAVKANSRGLKYGFPLKLEPRYLSQFLERGMTVVIIKETDRSFGRLKERLPVVVLRPAQDDN